MERIASTIVSIPLEQGNVFRLNLRVSRRVIEVVSQSLWNRAMSFDFFEVDVIRQRVLGLNPFGTGQCLST